MKQKNKPLIIIGLVICLLGLFIVSGLLINITMNKNESNKAMNDKINVQSTSKASEESLNEDEVFKEIDETTPTDSKAEQEIVDVDKDVNTITDSEEVEKLTPTEISEEEAKQIALKAVPGIVTDIVKEKKYGQMVYTVEVDPNPGVETDVFIDIYTGEVLLIET
jgi:uncharacterized membrane protein YkoI